MANSLFRSILNAFRTKVGPYSADLYQEFSNGDAAVDLQGNLWTVQAAVPATGTGFFTYQAVPAVATANIRNTKNILTQCGGFNDSGGTIYVQLHNVAGAIGAGAAPVMTFLAPANSSFSWDPSRTGRYFSTGLSFGVSSTRDTYTALGTSIFFFAEGYNITV